MSAEDQISNPYSVRYIFAPGPNVAATFGPGPNVPILKYKYLHAFLHKSDRKYNIINQLDKHTKSLTIIDKQKFSV